MNFDINSEQLSSEAYVSSPGGEVDLSTAPELKQHATRDAAIPALGVLQG